MAFLKKIDIFGQSITLMFNKNHKFKTNLGGVFTILMILIIVALAFNAGQELVYKEKPKVTITNIYSPISPLIQIEDEVLLFAFQILDSNFTQYYDESIVKL